MSIRDFICEEHDENVLLFISIDSKSLIIDTKVFMFGYTPNETFNCMIFIYQWSKFESDHGAFVL